MWIRWLELHMISEDECAVAQDDTFIQQELARLREEHRDLDSAIRALESSAEPDTLQIQRLKKRKLALKDRISTLDDSLMPDIIA